MHQTRPVKNLSSLIVNFRIIESAHQDEKYKKIVSSQMVILIEQIYVF